MLVSHLHLCYLVLRRSRLLLFLPSFKFHLPERWSVVTFLSSQFRQTLPLPLFQLLLCENDLVGRLIGRPEVNTNLMSHGLLRGYVCEKRLIEEDKNIWFNFPTTKTTWLTGQWSWTTQMRLCLIRIHRHFPQLPLHDRSSGFWKS